MGMVPLEKLQSHITYRGLTLDPFQEEALQLIDEDFSVLVAAPTGVGKTLIADYLIEKVFQEKSRVVYTAPIKALSNQKFKEFKAHIGPDAVGILTGDTVINPEAPILIMTTEIFRNLLQEDPERVADVRYVIFDEIHYIDDPERGSVWEESLIFMPKTMRFLGLSATIPNVQQLADWIASIHEQKIQVVTHDVRAVPLQHSVFEKSTGPIGVRNFRKRLKKLAAKHADNPREAQRTLTTKHTDLVEYLQGRDYLPCLFFTFSRRRAEVNALELGEQQDFLDAAQKQKTRDIVNNVAKRYPQIESSRWTSLRRLVLRGIGYHHAGMLPVLKDVVEELFTHRLLRVLYCTETFAVGLNFPCRSVCFDSSTKWDGTSFRPLTNREYFQMAGRAGRRGIDEKGYVFTLVDLNYFDAQDFPSMKEQDVEPLRSQFSLTYNSILNLTKNYDADAIYRILGMNFAAHQAVDELQTVQEAIAEAEAELSGFCSHMETERCPLVYDRLSKKLERYRSQLRERPGKGKRQRLRQQIRSLEGSLANVEREECTAETAAKCRKNSARFRRLGHRHKQLLKRRQALDPKEKYIKEFHDKQQLLQSLGYIDGRELTTPGHFAAQIHGQELLVTELFMDGLFHQFTEPELCALAVAVGYEPRKAETKLRHRINFSPVYKILYQIGAVEAKHLGYTTMTFHDHIAVLVHRWASGESFASIMEAAQIDEGDIVFGFRRGIDMMRQVRNAAREDKYLNAKLRDCIAKMDRDEVSIWL